VGSSSNSSFVSVSARIALQLADIVVGEQVLVVLGHCHVTLPRSSSTEAPRLVVFRLRFRPLPGRLAGRFLRHRGTPESSSVAKNATKSRVPANRPGHGMDDTGAAGSRSGPPAQGVCGAEQPDDRLPVPDATVERHVERPRRAATSGPRAPRVPRGSRHFGQPLCEEQVDHFVRTPGELRYSPSGRQRCAVRPASSASSRVAQSSGGSRLSSLPAGSSCSQPPPHGGTGAASRPAARRRPRPRPRRPGDGAISRSATLPFGSCTCSTLSVITCLRRRCVCGKSLLHPGRLVAHDTDLQRETTEFGEAARWNRQRSSS
jgi:hypothetical protein